MRLRVQAYGVHSNSNAILKKRRRMTIKKERKHSTINTTTTTTKKYVDKSAIQVVEEAPFLSLVQKTKKKTSI